MLPPLFSVGLKPPFWVFLPQAGEEIQSLAGAAGTCKVTFLLSDLRAYVRATVTASGVQNALLQKLDNAGQSYDACNLTAARNQLAAFIHQTMAQAGKKISQADADFIIAAAEKIIEQMGG